MPITLAVLDDYPLVVAGLRAVLDPYSDRVHVVELDVKTSVVSRVDVVLQDTFASQRGPAPTPHSMTGPGTPKRVIFSWNADPESVRFARDGGADGYLLKSIVPNDLVDALERISRGQLIFLQHDIQEEWAPILGRWPGDEHGLSGRESEILALICQGLSNIEIAQQTYIGINTVKTYIRSAYRKIGATSRSQAVIWGLSHGFEPTAEHRFIES